jgi:protein-S-isoprenylcysteine O-methyltransferase Ste14
MVERIAMFAYGVASYLVFLVTFLYAVGFIGGFGVPTRLDGARPGSLAAALAVDAALLALFAVQHSVMARRWFKDWWTRFVPRPTERATYVLFSSVALLLLFALWRPMGGTIWAASGAASGAARVILYALFAFGWALLLYCTFLINHFDLFGLRQVWLALVDRP